MKKVSIVMPVYNGEDYLRESLDSILNQTYANWELIIVNEFGSSEEATSIIKEYAKKDTRIIYIQNDKREGIAESLNIGLRKTTGEYIARMDSDDISLPLRLEKQVEYLDQHDDIILCGIIPEFFGPEKMYWDIEMNPEQIATNIFFYTPCVHPTIMFRRSVMDEYQIFYNPNYKATEDYEIFSRIVNVGKITNIDDQSLFKYRVYPNNTTKRNNDIGIKLYEDVIKNSLKNYLDIEITDEEAMLLDSHSSIKEKTGKELYDSLVKLDLLLKRILLATKDNKKYKLTNMFKTLKKRWQELNWTIQEKEKNNAVTFFVEKSIFNYDSLTSNVISKEVNADITVLMPVYNSEKYILDAVLSILNQSYKNFVILIMMEYGTNDLTEEYLSLLKDKRIKIVKNEEKLGLAASLNKGIRMANTKYIARMDADDLSLRNRLELQRNFMEEHEDYALVCAWQRHFGDFGTYIHKSSVFYEELKASMLFKCDICHSTVMFRTDVMKNNNYYYDENMAMEDYDLWVRMLSKEKMCCLPEILGEYRIHGGNITQSKIQKVIESEVKIISRSLEQLDIKKGSYDERLLIGWENIYQDNPDLIPKAEKLFKKIINNNQKLHVYDENYLEEVINKRRNWMLGKEDYVELEKETSLSFKTKVKKGLKKVIKPFVYPFYSRLMNRVGEKIDERINEQCNWIHSLEERINVQDKLITDLEHKYSSIFNGYKPYDGGKIKIAILFQVPSFWPSMESFYYTILYDTRFELKFYLIDLPDKEPTQMASAKQFLKERKIDYEILTIEKLKEFSPHVALMQTPYDTWHRTREFSTDNLKQMGIRLIYIPYGLEFGADPESLNLQFANHFYNNLWRIYTLSAATQRFYCLYSRLTLEEVRIPGHPKFDGLYNKSCTTNYDFRKRAGKKKIVLVKIHFPKQFNNEIVTPDLKIYEKLVQDVNKFPDCYFIFMLHPLMFDQNKCPLARNLIKLLENNQDIFVFKDDDYREPLYAADMFICDRSSISFEVAAFDKPVLFLENANHKETFVPEFEEFLNSYEKGTSYEDVVSFLNQCLKGIDQKKKERNEQFHKIVPKYDGQVAKRIVDSLYSDFESMKDGE